MEHTIYVVVQIKVESKLGKLAAITEYEENCDYEFKSTKNVEVKTTEIIGTTMSNPLT